MVMNGKKTKALLFKFSKNYQFFTRLTLKGEIVEFIPNTRLLGRVIQTDFKWDHTTSLLVKNANDRMEIFRRVASFSTPLEDLKTVYTQFVRSISEQTAVEWHSSLTQKNSEDLERVLKTAIRILLGDQYNGYEYGLTELGIDTLEKRREQLCLMFGK